MKSNSFRHAFTGATTALLAFGAFSTAQAQDNTIRVGVSLRMIVENGLKYGQMTKDELDGVEINGKKIQVTLLDDECKPDKGVANVNRLILENKVHLIIGSTCSSVSIPMVDITAKEEIPQIIPHSTNTTITKKGSAWVFRTSVSERFYAAIHAKYLAENAGKKIAYLYTNDGAALSFVKDYKEYMKKTYNVDPRSSRKARKPISTSGRHCSRSSRSASTCLLSAARSMR